MTPTRTIADRFDVIQQYIRSGDVLDLGCVDSRPARDSARQRLERKPNLLFRRIVEANPDTLGADIDPDGVEALKSLGFKAVVGNVETMDLARRFDAIVAGELIEHLENPGLFLRNMCRHLKPAGVIIISTPNPFYQGQAWKIWRYGRPMVHEDHTNWQDPTTLSHLMDHCGYEVFDAVWVQPARSVLKTWKRLLRPYFAHGFMLLGRLKPGAAR
ncbi:MAG: class I SAM-dependent methyltransferase [Tepidisphaerales bacterium]